VVCRRGRCGEGGVEKAQHVCRAQGSEKGAKHAGAIALDGSGWHIERPGGGQAYANTQVHTHAAGRSGLASVNSRACRSTRRAALGNESDAPLLRYTPTCIRWGRFEKGR